MSLNAVPRTTDEPVRILYMEDDAGLARLFQKRLQRNGYMVDLAADGREGLERYQAGSYDILAVDYKMPVCDGLEVISLLASRGKVPPTIMLTANGDEAVAVEALKLGASDYIVKDAAGGYIRLLPSVIERLLEKRRLEDGKRQALEALRQSEERLRAITQSASDAIISFDQDGRILLWNRRAQAIFGYSPGEAQQMEIARIIPERFQRTVEEQLQRLQQGTADDAGNPVEIAALRKDGREVPVEVSFSVWKSEQEICFTAIMRDIADRKRTQEALQEAARLDATATLAGGIANQFNNLLFGVLGNTELLQMRLEDRPDAIGRLEIVSQQAQRASDLVQQMLAFARRGQYQPVVMNLNDSIRKILQAQEASLGPGVVVEQQLDGNLWRISADPTQISQAVSNLLTNAVEALEEGGGRITLSTRNVVIDERTERRSHRLGPGPYVCFTAEDTGCGMSPEVLAKIYTPFFTTKFQGRGLGMAAVWGIVQHHGGHIDISSHPGEGTRIQVFVPAIDSEVRIAAKKVRSPAPRGTETVLVVDEEEVFVSVTQEYLEMLGYRVLLASTGAQALELARSHRGPIHLVLLDTNLTSMNPATAHAELIDACPDVKVILCSSDPDQTATALLEAGASAFLRKPFGLDILGLEIRRALDE